MIHDQIEGRGITHAQVLEAMGTLSRRAFLPPELWPKAYEDHPVPLGPGATLSQPYIVALMLSALGPIQGKKVLEVGSGCGYVLALLARMGAEAFGIEWDAHLAHRSRVTLERLGCRAHVAAGDGALGWPEAAPFEALVLSCATPALPTSLMAQLTPQAVILFPEGHVTGPQTLIRLQNGQREELCGVAFVGLRQ